MIEMRWAKIVMVGGLALFALLVCLNNLIDYGSNFAFVRHVLSMDTTFPGNALRGRAIADPTLHHLAYGAIILGEAVTGLLFCGGNGDAVAGRARAGRRFQRAKRLAVLGAACGFHRLVHRLHGDRRRMVCHVAIAAMERATGRVSLYRIILLVLIFRFPLRDEELPEPIGCLDRPACMAARQ